MRHHNTAKDIGIRSGGALKGLRLFPAVAGILLAATLHGALADVPDPAARPNTILASGYVLAVGVRVNASPVKEVTGRYTVDANGHIRLPVPGTQGVDVTVAGATVAEARRRIAAVLTNVFKPGVSVDVVLVRIPRFQVLVEGATLRNGPVTLVDGAHLSDLVAEVGTLPTADLAHVSIARVGPNGGRTVLSADFGSFLRGNVDRFTDPALQNGDVVTFTVVPGPAPVVAVQGAVTKPGFYAYQSGMTVRQALVEAGGLTPRGDPDRITLCKVGERRSITVNGIRAMEGAATDNLLLEPGDALFVAPRDTGRRWSVVGAVPNPVTMDYKGPVLLTKAIAEAGGFKPNADRKGVTILKNMLTDPAHARALTIDYDKIAKGEQPDIPLDPGDMVQVPEKKHAPNGVLDLGLLLLRFFAF
ncbi:MAG: SLBB domain-containing protein [Chthonomonadales bacterium]